MAEVVIGEISWERMIRAVERVRERLLRATNALERAGIAYAVAGGNAVADVSESEFSSSLRVLQLEALVRMKLTSYRDKDRTHLRDLISVGLVGSTWPAWFAPELAERLQVFLDDAEG